MNKAATPPEGTPPHEQHRPTISRIHAPERADAKSVVALDQPQLVRKLVLAGTGPAGGDIPNSELTIYPDAGHGGIFQYDAQFVPTALEFLGR